MTAASEHLASLAPRAPRWERLLVVLGICLPVPLFAATGLTIPLPASVERLAAALVPWVETAMVDSNRALLHGTIVLAPGEQRESAAPRDVATAVVSEHRSPIDGSPHSDVGANATDGTDTGAAPNPVGPEASPATAPEDSKSEPVTKPDPGTEEPGDEPDPIETTVDDLGQTVGSTVEDVEATADEVLSPVTDDLLGGTVTGILPRLGG
jgi:hypothetical protein